MNLYLSLDRNKNSFNFLERSVADIQRRHISFKKLCDGRDGAEVLFDLLFVDNMPFNGFISNREREKQNPRYAQMAIRVRVEGRENWPFPPHCSFMAIGSWNAEHPSPIFIISKFMEVADLSARSFEQEITAFAVHDSLSSEQGAPRVERTNNLLTPGLLEGLPPISLETGRQLGEWSEFLAWKRKLIQKKMRGVRYIEREWRNNHLVFTLVGESAESIQKDLKALGRNTLIAVESGYSGNPWVFSSPEKENRKQLNQLGQATGKRPKINPITKGTKLLELIRESTWDTPCYAELEIFPTEDDINKLENSEEQEEIEEREKIINRIPESGFLTISMTGDMSLVKRHEQSLRQLQEQAGYAPYLASYLFEADQVSRPKHLEAVTQWHRADLNTAQKEAVVKILSAPDLCLIQGPPGTGKTTVIAEAIIQLVRRGQRVLLASQAHTAVDNALDRLGHDSSLRAVRLARFQSKVSDDGEGFIGSASMQRYYNALSKQVETRLSAWRRTDEDLRLLQSWYERAGFVLKDEQELGAQRKKFESQLADSEAKLKQAQQDYHQAAIEINEDIARRGRLENVYALLSGDTPDLHVDLRDIDAKADSLAICLMKCADYGLLMRFSLDDWRSDIAGRGKMLSYLLDVWQSFQSDREGIEADVRRLKEAEHGALQDTETRLRIESIKKEVSLLAEKMEDDDSFVEPWRAKRKQLKELQGSETKLDEQRYRIFKKAETWCAPIEDAKRLADEINSCVGELNKASFEVERELETLKAEVLKELEAPKVDEPDSRRLEAAQSQINQALQDLDSLGSRCKKHEAIAAELLKDDAIMQGNRLPAMPDASIAKQVDMVAQTIEALKKRLAASQRERDEWENLLKEWAGGLQQAKSAQEDWEQMGNDFLTSCNVVAISCNENEQTLNDVGQTSFDVAIIDEVSKATPLELLMPLMRARRAVLVGDHRQLPPLFQEGDDARSIQDEFEENEEGSSEEAVQSLLTKDNLQRFEKMVTASLFKSHFESADDSIRARLNIQFRMHPQIMGMVNPFYEGQLECGLLRPDDDPDARLRRTHDLTLENVAGGSPILKPEDHVLWVDTTYNLHNQIHREDMQGNQPLRTNRLEAELIAETLEQIELQSASQGYSRTKKRKIGVVSFYANQCREIRSAIRRRRPKEAQGRYACLDVEVNTVIRYQGKEKPIILVSLVRHDGYDPRRSGKLPRRRSSKANVARFEFINVAFSRAQELLVVFGARSMYESYEVELPNMDRPGTTKRTVYKDILDQLDRNARLVHARELMRPENSTSGSQQSKQEVRDVKNKSRSTTGGHRS